jgi:hypothetical protein
MAVASADYPTAVRTLWLYGNRSLIKFQATQMALNMVRRLLIGTLDR